MCRTADVGTASRPGRCRPTSSSQLSAESLPGSASTRADCCSAATAVPDTRTLETFASTWSAFISTSRFHSRDHPPIGHAHRRRLTVVQDRIAEKVLIQADLRHLFRRYTCEIYQFHVVVEVEPSPESNEFRTAIHRSSSLDCNNEFVQLADEEALLEVDKQSAFNAIVYTIRKIHRLCQRRHSIAPEVSRVFCHCLH